MDLLILLKELLRKINESFIFASSSSVYGNCKNYPYKENELNLQPTSIYGATKLSNEILAQSIFAESKTITFGLRFFTVYGPIGRPDMAYFRLFNSALNDIPFKMFGDGSAVRDFTYIEDVLRSIENVFNVRLNGFEEQLTRIKETNE